MSWDFAAELARFGPGRGSPAPGRSFARSYCARVARSHYENFAVASVLLPRPLLPHFHAVYAFCRWADDLADETAGGDTALSLLDWWRGELLGCFEEDLTPRPPLHEWRGGVQAGIVSGNTASGVELHSGTQTKNPLLNTPSPFMERGPGGEVFPPSHPVTVALRETIRRFGIPPDPFLNLIAAFEQDQRVKRYAKFADLLGYCRNSANPVGRLVLHLFECHDEERAALSDEVCTGLQLANFWQDVARDHAIGRVYLPLEDMTRFGVTEADIAARRFTSAFGELLRFQVDRTRGYFDRGSALLPRLPRRARANVGLFVAGGRAILDAIERAKFDVLTRRPVVSKARKVWLLLKAIASGLIK